MRLEAFAGLWRITRRIEDRLAGGEGRLTGTARFEPDPGGDGLVAIEEGTLVLGGAPPMAATRRYLWREEVPGAITVRFADGRFFHSFAPGAAAPEARHDCAPDLYRVRYDFSAWPDWRAEWRVTGPRKDYTMTTDFRRAGQVDGIAP